MRTTPPARHGSHAGPPGGWRPELRRNLAAPGLAVLCVGVVVVVLLLLGGHPASGPNPATVGVGSSTTHTFAPSPRGTPSPAPVDSSKSPAPRVTPAARPVPRLAVLVLNNSMINHLAHRVAGELQAAGWPINGIGNLTGRLPATTLFYARGAAAAARALAARFPQITSVVPRPGWLPGSAALTLVVTRYWS